MASSDEDDLEALRNAALASLRQKQAAQEPQGIQVVSRLGVPTVNQYNDYNHQISEPVANPDNNLEYTGYVEVPFHFQQAVRSRQARGRRGGFFRGRGRGRGNRFPPKPDPESALIVIQPSGGEEEQVKIQETSRDSRPFLLRPQDKWASTESGSQASTPTRPKDTSKFSRYDDATDSEDDDDLVEEHSEDPVSATMNMSLDDVSSDTELKGDSDDNNEVEVNKHNEAVEHEDNSEVEVHNSKEDLDNLNDVNEKEAGMADDSESAINITQDISVDEDQSKLNSSPQTLGKSYTDVTVKTARNEEINAVNCGANEFPIQGANISVNEENSLSVSFNALEGSDDTPLRDEPTPVQDEIRHEDSVSNSYSAFSRFNRRNRGDSGGDSDDEESDLETKSVPNSRSSSMSKDSSRPQSESESDIGDNDSDNALSISEALTNKDSQNVSEIPPANLKTDKGSQESKSSVTSFKSSAQSTSSESGSDSNSSSASSTSASSSSTSSSSSSESESEQETSSENKAKSVSKLKARNVDSQTGKDKKSNSYSEREKPKLNDLKEKNLKRLSEKQTDTYRDVGTRKADYRSKESKRGYENSPQRKLDRDRSFHRKPVRDSIEEVKADPEFDATNYRDESMYQRSSRRDRHRDQYDKYRSGSDRKVDRERNVRDGKSRVKNGKDEETQSANRREKSSEKRYFEEIGKLKKEDKKGSRDSIGPEIPSSNRQKHRSRSNSLDSKKDKNKTLKAKTGNHRDKSAKPSKSDSYLASTQSSKSKTDSKDSSNHKGKERRKSDEKLSRKGTSVREKSKQVITKEEKQAKRKSIEEKLQRLASQTGKSDMDSESDKSVSSLSDLSSDSETETWRDKKHGASRKTADIELERRRRELKERDMKREKMRVEKREKTERGDGDRDWNKKSKHKDSYSDEDHLKRHGGKGDFRVRGKLDSEENSRQTYYHKKKMVFYEDANRKKFEEISSESDSDVRKGVISVVKTGKKKGTKDIPSPLNINVSRSRSSKKDKVRSKSPKKERLVIQVEKSSDEEISSTKSRKKKVKKRKKWSSDEEVEKSPLKQTVNVTFNKDAEAVKSRTSVYERLGTAVTRNSPADSMSGDAGCREVTLPSGGKRIKLSSGGKYRGTSKQGDDDNTGGGDDALNLRIRKIQEKNAEIMRRKMEIEQDKQKYG